MEKLSSVSEIYNHMPHIHDKIDFTVDVYIVYKNKVLLRKHDKYGIWLAVGGHIELNEDPNQAALREVKEEVGLDVLLLDTRQYKENRKGFNELITPVCLNRHAISDTHEHINMGYFAKSFSDKVIPENPSDQWKWCDKSDIETLTDIQPSVVFYAKLALQTINSA